MSPLQYGMMKHIRRENPPISAARMYKQVTLSSLLYRGWVTTRHGNLVETAEGSAELDRYIHSKLPERGEIMQDNDLAPTVTKGLKYYRVITMKKREAA